MSIATDLGFKIGEVYTVTSPDRRSLAAGITAGTKAVFVRDDDTRCPWFLVNGKEESLYMDHIDGPEILPMTSPVHTAYRIVRNFEDTASALKPRQRVEVLQTVNSRRVVSGKAVLVAPEGGDPELVCSSCIEPIPSAPDHSAKIKELEEENASIEKQVNNMLDRVDRKLAFKDDNAREIARLREEMQ